MIKKDLTQEEALNIWLDTLEKYPERQVASVLGLRHKDGEEQFCCLGQLCDIVLEPKYKTFLQADTPDYLETIEYNGEESELPNEVVEFMGFNGPLGELQGMSSLADMNDVHYTWPEIAKFIRENPEKVFSNDYA